VAHRDKYRDNDDQRGYVQDRGETKPDTKGEARGDARETVGNNARGTDANPIGPEGNDNTRLRPRMDEFDRDLEGDLSGTDRRDGQQTGSKRAKRSVGIDAPAPEK
jgi:hypothetical protein